MKEEPYIQVDKDSFDAVMDLADMKNLKCFECGKEINKENFGLIARDFACCDDIFCLMHGIDRFEKYRKVEPKDKQKGTDGGNNG